MNDTLARQWAMLRHIPRYPRRIDAPALKDRLERAGYDITLRSVQRDLQRLSLSLPLHADNARPQGWSWQADAEQMHLPFLEPQAALTFHLVERYMRTLLPDSTLKYLAPWFSTARGVLEQSESGMTRWPDKIRVLPRGFRLQQPDIDQEVHSRLYQGLLEERKVSIRYLPRNAAEPKDYVVNPLGVVVRDSLVYLVCTMWDYPSVRQLVLHRIQAVTVLDEAAARPAGFDLGRYIADGGFGYAETGKFAVLVAIFTETAAIHLHECPMSADQKIEPDEPGYVRITATVPDTMELRWWLLGFGEQVTVLEPAELRDRMKSTVQAMMHAYVPP